MVSTSLIGTDTQVRVVPFWTDESLPSDFLAQLNGWADLTELVLPPGGEALKIARHVYEGQVFTWIGMYRHADAFESSRKQNFIGVGFFLREPKIADATAAMTYLYNALQAFTQKYIRDGRQTASLVDIDQASIAIPATAAALDASIHPRIEPGGLAPAAKSRLGTGLVFIDNKQVAADLAARYLEWAQSGWQFAKYHTLIIGTKPDRMLMTKPKIITPRELDRLKPPAPPRPPSPRAAPGQTQKRRTASTGHGGPRLSSRPQSLALDEVNVTKDRHDEGILKGIVGTLCAVMIVWILYITQLWVTGAPIPAPTATPAPTTIATSPPTTPAAGHDLNGALDATEAFFRSLCKADRAGGLWSQAANPNDIATFTRDHVPLCPIALRLGTAQESGVAIEDGKSVLSAQVELTVIAGPEDSPWTSAGRVVLRTQLGASGKPGAWKVYSASFDNPLPAD